MNLWRVLGIAEQQKAFEDFENAVAAGAKRYLHLAQPVSSSAEHQSSSPRKANARRGSQFPPRGLSSASFKVVSNPPLMQVDLPAGLHAEAEKIYEEQLAAQAEADDQQDLLASLLFAKEVASAAEEVSEGDFLVGRDASEVPKEAGGAAESQYKRGPLVLLNERRQPGRDSLDAGLVGFERTRAVSLKLPLPAGSSVSLSKAFPSILGVPAGAVSVPTSIYIGNGLEAAAAPGIPAGFVRVDPSGDDLSSSVQGLPAGFQEAPAPTKLAVAGEHTPFLPEDAGGAPEGFTLLSLPAPVLALYDLDLHDPAVDSDFLLHSTIHLDVTQPLALPDKNERPKGEPRAIRRRVACKVVGREDDSGTVQILPSTDVTTLLAVGTKLQMQVFPKEAGRKAELVTLEVTNANVAEIAPSKPSASALAYPAGRVLEKVFFAMPCNFESEPAGYTVEGTPFYGAPCELLPYPRSLERKIVGFDRDGFPLALADGYVLPPASGFTLQGVPYYFPQDMLAYQKAVASRIQSRGSLGASPSGDPQDILEAFIQPDDIGADQDADDGDERDGAASERDRSQPPSREGGRARSADPQDARASSRESHPDEQRRKPSPPAGAASPFRSGSRSTRRFSRAAARSPAEGHVAIACGTYRASCTFHLTLSEAQKAAMAHERPMISIVVQPADVFTASPLVFPAPVNGQQEIVVTFDPVSIRRQSISVHGTMRAIAPSGKALASTKIEAFKGPSFQVRPAIVHVGWLEPGVPLETSFTCRNLSPEGISCEVVVPHSGDHKHVPQINIPARSFELSSGEERAVQLFCEASVVGRYRARFDVVGPGGERQAVQLEGLCGHPIAVYVSRGMRKGELRLEDDAPFGSEFSLLTGDSVGYARSGGLLQQFEQVRRSLGSNLLLADYGICLGAGTFESSVVVHNMSSDFRTAIVSCSIPAIEIDASPRECVVDSFSRSLTLHLEPLQEAVLTARLPDLAKLQPGPFFANLEVSSPGSRPVRVALRGFVGQPLEIPVEPDIHLPPVLVGGECRVLVPVENASSLQLQFTLTFEAERTFLSYASTAGGKSAKQKPTVSGKELVTIGPLETISLAVSFAPQVKGVVRTPIKFNMISPSQAQFPARIKGNLHFVAIAISPKPSGEDDTVSSAGQFTKEIIQIRDWLSGGSSVVPAALAPRFAGMKKGNVELPALPSPAFQFSADVVQVGGLGRKAALEVSSGEDHSAVLLTSPGMHALLAQAGDQDVSGEEVAVLAESALQLSVLHKSRRQAHGSTCLKGFVCLASLNTGALDAVEVVSSESEENPLTMQPTGEVSFKCRVGSTHTQAILIQNASKARQKWQLIAVKTSENQEAPFTVQPEEGFLEAGGSQYAAVDFAPAQAGIFSQPLTLVCQGRDLQSCRLVGQASPRVLIGLPISTLDFGVVLLGDKRQIEFTLANHGELPEELEMTVHSPFSASFETEQTSATLESNNTIKVTILYEPNESGKHRADLWIALSDITHSVRLEGVAGTLRVLPPATIDFGRTRLGTASICDFTVRNTGSLPASLLQVVSAAPHTCELEVVGEESGGNQLLHVYQHVNLWAMLRLNLRQAVALSKGSSLDNEPDAHVRDGTAHAMHSKSKHFRGVGGIAVKGAQRRTITVSHASDSSDSSTGPAISTIHPDHALHLRAIFAPERQMRLSDQHTLTFVFLSSDTANSSEDDVPPLFRVETQLRGSSLRPVVVTPSVLDFGIVPVANSTQHRAEDAPGRLHIRAVNESLETQSIHVSRFSQGFELDPSCPSTASLGPGELLSLPVQCTPRRAQAAISGSCSIQSDFVHSVVFLKGVGASADIVFQTPDVMDFGTVKAQRPARGRISVRNVGLLPTVIRLHSDSNEVTMMDERVQTLSIPIASGQRLEIPLVVLSITANPIRVPLTLEWETSPGSPVQKRVVQVKADIGVPAFVMPVRSVDMGLVVVNNMSQVELKLVNSGRASCIWQAFSQHAFRSILWVDPASGEIPGSGEQCVRVSLKPNKQTTHGGFVGEITFDTDGGESTLSVHAMVLPPQLIIQNDLDLDFGIVALGTEASRAIQVSNVGKLSVEIGMEFDAKSVAMKRAAVPNSVQNLVRQAIGRGVSRKPAFFIDPESANMAPGALSEFRISCVPTGYEVEYAAKFRMVSQINEVYHGSIKVRGGLALITAAIIEDIPQGVSISKPRMDIIEVALGLVEVKSEPRPIDFLLLTNQGNLPATVNLQSSGKASEYITMTPASFELEPASSVVVQTTLNPAAPGLHSAEFLVQGAIANPTIVVYGKVGEAALKVEPLVLDFGVCRFAREQLASVQLYNEGTYKTQYEARLLDEAGKPLQALTADGFTLHNATGEIESGDSVNLTVIFKPSKVFGPEDGISLRNLEIAWKGIPVTVLLKGSGADQRLLVHAPDETLLELHPQGFPFNSTIPLPASVQYRPSSLSGQQYDFMYCFIGQTSWRPLLVSNLSVRTCHARVFTRHSFLEIDGENQLEIPPLSAFVVKLGFLPPGDSFYEGMVTIEDEEEGDVVNLGVCGAGALFQWSIEGSLELGSVAVGSETTRIIQIHNQGLVSATLSLKVEPASLASAVKWRTQLHGPERTPELESHSTLIVYVSVSTPAEGPVTGSLVIRPAESALEEIEPVHVPIEATAHESSVQVSSLDAVDFSNANYGEEAVETRELTNDSPLPINFTIALMPLSARESLGSVEAAHQAGFLESQVLDEESKACWSVHPVSGRLSPHSKAPMRITFNPPNQPGFESSVLLAIFQAGVQRTPTLLVLRGCAGFPTLRVDPPELAFGDVPTRKSAHMQFKLQNSGTGSLSYKIQWPLLSSQDFELSGNLSGTLLAQEIAEFRLTYKPLKDNDVTLSIPVQSSGVSTTLVVSARACTFKLGPSWPQSLHLGDVVPGDRKATEVVFQNGCPYNLPVAFSLSPPPSTLDHDVDVSAQTGASESKDPQAKLETQFLTISPTAFVIEAADASVLEPPRQSLVVEHRCPVPEEFIDGLDGPFEEVSAKCTDRWERLLKEHAEELGQQGAGGLPVYVTHPGTIHQDAMIVRANLAIPPLDIDGQGLEFGIVRAHASVAVNRRFVVSSTSAFPVPVVIESPDPAFSCSPSSFVLRSGINGQGSVTVQVSFSSENPGTFNFALVVRPLLSGAKPLGVTVSGRSVKPALDVAKLQPMHFKPLFIGQDTFQAFSLNNTSKTDVFPFAINCTHPAFTVTPSSGVVEPGRQIDCTVTFCPAESSLAEGIVSILSEMSELEYTFEVSGEGVQPTLTADSPGFDLGVVPFGCKVGRQLVVTNACSLPLAVHVTRVPFCVALSHMDLHLAPGESATLSVTYAPVGGQVHSGVIEFSKGMTPLLAVPFRASGGRLDISLSPAELQCGQVPVKSDIHKVIRVQNRGEAPAQLFVEQPAADEMQDRRASGAGIDPTHRRVFPASAVQVEGAKPGTRLEVQLSPTEFRLQPGESRDVRATLRPLDAGRFEFVVRVVLDGVLERKAFDLPVSLTGDEIEISDALAAVLRSEQLDLATGAREPQRMPLPIKEPAAAAVAERQQRTAEEEEEEEEEEESSGSSGPDEGEGESPGESPPASAEASGLLGGRQRRRRRGKGRAGKGERPRAASERFRIVRPARPRQAYASVDDYEVEQCLRLYDYVGPVALYGVLQPPQPGVELEDVSHLTVAPQPFEGLQPAPARPARPQREPLRLTAQAAQRQSVLHALDGLPQVHAPRIF
eukprot:tig00000949_g5746.t1